MKMQWMVSCRFMTFNDLDGTHKSTRSITVVFKNTDKADNWQTLFIYYKVEGSEGFSVYRDKKPRQYAKLEWQHLAWGESGLAPATGVVPDNVMKEVFHLLYTFDHPGTQHSYDSIVYDSPS